MTLPDELDELLVELLRAPPGVPGRPPWFSSNLLHRAYLHGVAGVVHAALVRSGVPIPEDEARAFERMAAVRQLEHDLYLRMLARIDEALATSGLQAVALKGSLLAERLYDVPSLRTTSDIDLMVAERDLDRTLATLRTAGYRQDEAPSEERFRREHHHLHCHSPEGPPLELHFHAYRGFGSVLRSEPLIERSRPLERFGFRAIRVLAPEDELVYLAVHAAAHRFVRFGWLYDLKLLLGQMSASEIETAARRASSVGYARPLALAALLLEELLGVPAATLRPLQRLGRARAGLVRRLAGEPKSPVWRSATRLVYSAALCATVPSATRYVVGATLARARQVVTG